MDNTSTALQTTGGGQLGFVRAIDNVAQAVWAKAHENVAAEIAQGNRQFGELQIKAMESVEALRLTSGLDLASILIRYQILNEIRQNNLLAVHPGRYSGIKEMATEQGISMSELHDIMVLGDTVFPFLVREYGENAVADMWDELGKARIRELVPVISAAVQGARSQSTGVREAVGIATEQAAVQARSEGRDFSRMEPEEQRRRVAREVVEIGRRSPTVRELRQNLRGSHTPNILMLEYPTDEEVILVTKVNRDQRQMVSRLLGDHIDFQAVTAENAGWASLETTFTPIYALLERSETHLGDDADGE